MEKTNVMEYENTLPVGFNGTFTFTNYTDSDFVGKWGSKEYHFPAKSTSPIIITDQTPLEIQWIRKKFAKDLAEQEFYKSQAYGKLMKQERDEQGVPLRNSLHHAGTYSIEQLAPFIQRCLDPLPVAQATVTETHKPSMEEKLTKNEDGELNTTAVDKKMSLRKKALES